MTRDDRIIQDLYDSLEHMEPKERRYRAVDHVLSARKAMKAQDIPAAIRAYQNAVKELEKSSNQEAHLSIRALQEHIYLIQRGA